MRNIDMVVIHCSDTTPTMVDALVDPAVPVNVNTLRQWAKDKGKYDIEYHYVITNDGTTEVGLPLKKVGGHTVSDNETSIGICLIGGKEDENNEKFSSKTFKSLKKLLTTLKKEHDIKTIVGHSEIDSRFDSPKFDVQAWLKENDL